MTGFGEFEIMVRTLYGEARGEPRDGKHAVAWVIVNRTKLGKTYGGPSIEGVCLKPKQFSCWNLYDPMRVKIKTASFEQLMNCTGAALEVLAGKVSDPTGTADHYLNEEVTRRIRGGSLPDWADETKITARIGRHTFYKLH